MNVASMRQILRHKWLDREFVNGRGGATIEIIGASFLANEATIFGEPNLKYIAAELQWYATQSLNLDTFPGGAPAAWKQCAAYDGTVNSNYGWCLDNEANCAQRRHVVTELQRNPNSRRAVAIYTRPSMHLDAVEKGREDFICTNAVEYYIRERMLHCVVQMRSSDAVLGYRNDYAWQLHVLQQIATTLQITVGDIYWQAGSLHIYERHFFYLERM